MIKGLQQVVKNLNRQVRRIEGRTLAGLIDANIIIRRDMENSYPRIPVDTGNLRASYFCVTSKGRAEDGGTPVFKGMGSARMSSQHENVLSKARASASIMRDPAIIIGFTANYALPVHERFGTVNWNRPNSGPKFLEKALKNNEREILNAIRKAARIK